MLPEPSLTEATLRPALATPSPLSPDLETGMALRLNVFRQKKHKLDQHSPRRSDKYPFKWTVLGLVIVCSAFWAILAWLILS